MTDYVLYIHGANVRTPAYAARLDAGLRRRLGSDLRTTAVYWGDVSEAAERKVLEEWTRSGIWPKLCFPSLRSKMLLQLIGDGALYVSRAIGRRVVDRIYDAVKATFADRRPGDRLHVVAHSWGGVIVLDALFAARWLEPGVPGRDEVERMRDALFGMGGDRGAGLLLSSIATMGSPTSLFSLMNGDAEPPSSHDIGHAMRGYCSALYARTATPLRWNNYVHPADAFAYPVAPLLDDLLGERRGTVAPRDLLVRVKPLMRLLQAALGKTDLSAVAAGSAHNDYWNNPHVIAAIGEAIAAAITASQAAQADGGPAGSAPPGDLGAVGDGLPTIAGETPGAGDAPGLGGAGRMLGAEPRA